MTFPSGFYIHLISHLYFYVRNRRCRKCAIYSNGIRQKKKKKIEIYTYIVAHGKLSFKAITRQQNLE